MIDGSSLRIEDLYSFVSDTDIKIEITAESLEKVRQCRIFVDKNREKEIIYGINTGFGPMASHIIDKNQLHDLQQNLIRSHSVGMGNPIKEEYVLAAMIVRLNTFLQGYSGVTVNLIKHLETFINERIIPIVPEHGAVGTSGDLIQLAHIALALIGEGEVIYKGQRQPTAVVLKRCDIQPYILQPKEGLSLINGTSVMAGIASILTVQAETIINLATLNGAWALEMANAFSDSFSVKISQLRPHKGQLMIARTLSKILASSKLLQDRKRFNIANKDKVQVDHVHEIPSDVQDVYSLRCIPQILGPILDSINLTKNIIEVEINSVTDNPIVDIKAEKFLHGGNFHGDYVAYAIDQMKMTLVKLTMLSERRINYFLNSKLNRRYTPFINLNIPGITLALQGVQFVATSTTARSQTLAFPQYVHSISTNSDNQDVVSMGTDAALITSIIVENAFTVLAIESVVLAQAVDYSKNIKELSESTRTFYDDIRLIFPAVENDRTLYVDLEKVFSLIKNKKLTFIK